MPPTGFRSHFAWRDGLPTLATQGSAAGIAAQFDADGFKNCLNSLQRRAAPWRDTIGGFEAA
jgi:hypothetical protein